MTEESESKGRERCGVDRAGPKGKLIGENEGKSRKEANQEIDELN